MAGAAGDINAIFDKIAQILTLASKHQVDMYGSDHYTNVLRTEVEANSEYIGDPKKFARGTETRSITKTTYIDNYTQYYIEVLGALGFDIAPASSTSMGDVTADLTSSILVEETTYMPHAYGGLVYIPQSRVSNTLAPVFRILDFSVSQVNPTETRSRYAIYNLIAGIRGNQSAIIQPLLYWIFLNIKYDAIVFFMLLSDFSYSELCVKYKAANKPEPPKDLFTTFANMSRQTTLVKYVKEYMGLQLRAGVDSALLAKAKFTGGTFTLEDEKEMFSLNCINVSYEKISDVIMNDTKSKIFTSKLISSKVVHYDYGGALGNGQMSMVSVTTRTTRLSQNGTAQDDDYKYELVDTERVVVQANPITAVVSAGTASTNNAADIINVTIQIPCNNSDDIENLQKSLPTTVTQGSTGTKTVFDTVDEAINQFKALTTYSGIRSCKVQYTPAIGRAFVEYSYVSI